MDEEASEILIEFAERLLQAECEIRALRELIADRKIATEAELQQRTKDIRHDREREAKISLREAEIRDALAKIPKQ